MKFFERNHCAVSGVADLEDLHCFPKFPAFMGCVDHSLENDILEDMSWVISRTSGLIQLKRLLPLDVLYPDAHGAGVVGAIWEQHHRSFANFVHKFSPSSVFEIGGGHGILSRDYRRIENIPWVILEPNPTPVSDCPARFIRGFFDHNFRYSGAFDTVVHSHVFEHIYEPQEFMSHLSQFMRAGQHLIFSLPNQEAMMRRKYNNCINFEHTIFLTEPYVEFLLGKYGFRLVAKDYFLEDHSVFYAAVRDSSAQNIELPKNLYEENKNLYLDYVQYHEDLIGDLNAKVDVSIHPVYLFGAHVFSQYLIAFGLKTSKIVGLLDNDKNKQGRRLYGTNLMVNSPSVLTDVDRPIIVLKAGVYNQEIKAQINNINSDALFIE